MSTTTKMDQAKAKRIRRQKRNLRNNAGFASISMPTLRDMMEYANGGNQLPTNSIADMIIRATERSEPDVSR